MRIERIDQIDDYRRVAEEVFEKNYDFTTNQLTRALRTGCQEHRGYVAYAKGKPVSIGRLYTHPDSLFAGLYGGGTLRSHRGRGFYRALVAARAKDAAELGARYLLVDALPTSRPILGAHGVSSNHRNMALRVASLKCALNWRGVIPVISPKTR